MVTLDENLTLKKPILNVLALKNILFKRNYFTKPSNNSVKDAEEGLAASALITFPSGPIKINLGIALIP
ncbi:MAG: hypothetical protein LRY25_02620 [Flavobacterium sp.]|nr:hypothetical protein [Flavobacterium sp.]